MRSTQDAPNPITSQTPCEVQSFIRRLLSSVQACAWQIFLAVSIDTQTNEDPPVLGSVHLSIWRSLDTPFLRCLREVEAGSGQGAQSAARVPKQSCTPSGARMTGQAGIKQRELERGQERKSCPDRYIVTGGPAPGDGDARWLPIRRATTNHCLASRESAESRGPLTQQ